MNVISENIVLWLFIMITMAPLVFCPRTLFNCFALPQLLTLSMLSAVGMLLGVYNGVIPVSTPSIILICFLIYITLSVFWTLPIHNAKKEYGLQFTVLSIYLLSIVFLTDNIIKWISLSITGILLFNLAYGYLQTKNIDPFFSNKIKKGGYTDSAIGTIGNPNFFISFICGSFWFSIYCAYIFNISFFIIFIFSVYFIFFKSKVRAGQLAFMCSSLFMFLTLAYFDFLPFGNEVFFHLTLAGISLLILFFYIVLKVNWNTFFYKSIDPKGEQVWYATLRYRFCYWLAAWELIKEKPWFGHGLWSYRKEVYRAQAQINERDPRFLKSDRYITPQPRECHNDFIEHIVEFGLVGFSIFILFVGFIYYEGFIFLSESVGDKTSFLLMLVLLTNLTSLLVNGFFFFMLRTPASALMFWITCGMITYISVGDSIVTFNSNFWYVILAIIFLGIFIYETIIKRTIASFYYRKYCTTADLQEKNDFIVKAIKFAPHDCIYRTHAVILLQEQYPFLANLHASVLFNYYDGQVTQGMAFYNVALTRAKTRNIYDEVEFFLKNSNWVNPDFGPTLELLNSKKGVGVRSTYKGGRAEMRIPEDAVVAKVNYLFKEIENCNLKIELVKKEIEKLGLAKQNAELALQNVLLQEKKRMNIPDSWLYNHDEQKFVDPSTIENKQ